MQGDEDLVAKLSARLTEEIGNLPNDGKDHELRIKIKGDHGNINLGTQTFEVLAGKQPPPPGSDRERVCPQCVKPTWRYTQLCMHCDYDLHRHDAIEESERVEHRKEEMSRLMLKVFFGLAGVAALSFFIKDYLPASWRGWAIGVTVVAGFLAFVILQAQK